jgi:6-phosphogluconate dehydrogenase
MQIAIIGLGRMGGNMARRLLRDKHEVIVYNRTSAKTDELVREGAIGAYSLEEVADKLKPPRPVWIMLPAGVVDEYLEKFGQILSPDDVIIDGGNSHFTDDIRRRDILAKKSIHYLDAGVSGGVWGLEVGYCTMVGGEKEVFQRIEPALKTLAPKDGYLYCGKTGAGHFVKMVHNGIEYGMLEAYGEGFAVLEASPYHDSLNYAELSHLWNQGSVIRSWLLELAERAFADDSRLSQIRGYVDDTGEGRWTALQAIELAIPAPVITLSLMQRFRSRQDEAFSDKVIAALRNQFGGHAVKREKK